ncbi:helix-turn-helix domain-containing protein [Haloprofundus halophilus]|uniref:helix-turn-helix domain-containing protein n=1 Tax=Haloprofundus halophilus TaxID=2283527 RepID=UPI000E444A8C|nr:helix-turn-helix domain-containing protein [Haloprofundus halophilus]
MGKLDEVSTDRLRDALSNAADAKEAKRLVVALDYKDGQSVDELSERYGIPRSTLYSWLERFESDPVEAAVVDESRPGRPPKLAAEALAELRADAAASPSKRGYDADEWTTAMFREYIEERYGVTYSEGHVRRLLRRHG